MKTTTKNAGIKVNTGVRAGGVITVNHVRSGLHIKSAVKAGYICKHNHSVRMLAIG